MEKRRYQSRKKRGKKGHFTGKKLDCRDRGRGRPFRIIAI